MKERLLEWAMTLFGVLVLMTISGYVATKVPFDGWAVYLVGAILSGVFVLFPGAAIEDDKNKRGEG